MRRTGEKVFRGGRENETSNRFLVKGCFHRKDGEDEKTLRKGEKRVPCV